MVAVLKMPALSGAERRVFPRREVRGEAAGMRIDHDLAALRDPQLRLALRDVSFGGCSALSQGPLNPGERLSIMFPGQGGSAPWDARGRVLRCDASAMGYRIAVQFDPLLAA
jgi:PilZ domain